MIDPEQERSAARERWEATAPRWESGIDAYYAGALPVAHWMVERLAPQPGQTVLELAAGRGDVGLLAAELLVPGGRLILTDGAEAMVEVAKRHTAARGLPDGLVELKPMELEWVDEKLATIDGLLCRFGYQHAVDPEAALREARRVLKPGGRIVLAVWSPPEENLWLSALPRAAEELGLAAPPEPDAPGAFALSDRAHLADLLEDAGFDDPVIEPIDLVFDSPSLDAWWDTLREFSSTMRPLLDALSPAEHYRLRDAAEALWQPFLAADGSLAIPGRAFGAVATA
ncbi:MAG TPA: class I SAM-dependent methyltransferase [Baekduia sp.]|uniref:class I SAM-dependent methyltransferase n=1 Tax=Baekduia sp. TaxID=2600305 RepID=UPI002D7926C8|nr:class I SAM-dependent methyltransferase [Baekduia sp.]HET6505980.1 class I SAM-dependent methyltransferase [Baekduia sp.]